MWFTRKKAVKHPKLVVYRPQVLDPDITHHIIAAQPPQIRIIASNTADLLAVLLVGLLAAWLVTVANNTAQQFGAAPIISSHVNSQLSSDAAHASLPFLRHDLRKAPGRTVRVAADAQAVKRADPCRGVTMMNIVAHQDDDLLFINPRIAHALAQQHCVITVYVTAGDDGRGANYLYLREAGAEAAYNVMLGSTKPWQYHLLALPSGRQVMSATPLEDGRATLVFLRLPDGNLNGNGFDATAHESLDALHSSSLPVIRTVDGTASYTSEELTSTLTALMQNYRPTQINTQADDSSLSVTDHSDHIVTGYYATVAAQRYGADKHLQGLAVHYFMGYPIRSLPSNLNEKETLQKSAPFFAYAGDDPGVCRSFLACEESSSSYGAYLSRLYTQKR